MNELRDPNNPIDNLAIGTIIEVDGLHIVAELHPSITELSRIYGGDTYPIGQFSNIIKIHFGHRIIFAYVGRLRMKSDYELERGIPSHTTSDERIIEADLFGEGQWLRNNSGPQVRWTLRFERGVATYPLPQQTVYLTPKRELRYIYSHGNNPSIHLGEHVGTGDIKCWADINELLGKHSAVLGSTGAGKSATVAAILHSLLERGKENSVDNWNPRIVVLDPHNEYSSAFSRHEKLSTDDGSLKLPYWLLNFTETIALLIGKTEYVATSQANIVKKALFDAKIKGASLLKLDASKISVDSPVPFKLTDFIKNVEDDKPAQMSKQGSHNSILEKLDVLRRDARFEFLMKEWDGTSQDPLPRVLLQLLNTDCQPKVVDLSGVPNEVAGVSSAVIARTLFNVKIWQTPKERNDDPVLLVCEEAHRYVPNSGEAQYEAAQEAVRRIAKEGRKYGIGLLLVSQRPSEVEATVLSQCNSWIILRITNDTDRKHVSAILPDSMIGLTKMLSGLRRQEAIFVGQAAVLPSRILVRSIDSHQLPQSNDIKFSSGWNSTGVTNEQLNKIASRWRYQTK